MSVCLNLWLDLPVCQSLLWPIPLHGPGCPALHFHGWSVPLKGASTFDLDLLSPLVHAHLYRFNSHLQVCNLSYAVTLLVFVIFEGASKRVAAWRATIVLGSICHGVLVGSHLILIFLLRMLLFFDHRPVWFDFLFIFSRPLICNSALIWSSFESVAVAHIAKRLLDLCRNDRLLQVLCVWRQIALLQWVRLAGVHAVLTHALAHRFWVGISFIMPLIHNSRLVLLDIWVFTAIRLSATLHSLILYVFLWERHNLDLLFSTLTWRLTFDDLLSSWMPFW